MKTVQVLLGQQSYPIRIRPGCLVDLGEALVNELDASRVVVISTRRVLALHGGALASGFSRAALNWQRVTVPDGERAKTLRVVERIYDELFELEVDRQTLIVSLGGGALCDVAGYTASTYLRGLEIVHVPTSLLAQVDGCVGGKTALNHPRGGKNALGTFLEPRLVWIDPDVLTTLPARDRRAGLAEVVKVAAIWDADFFKWLEEEIDSVLRLDREALERCIARACALRAEIVGLDDRDGELRALLGFGHTLGHAIETVSRFRGIRHGEATAIGMVFAAHASERRGLAPEGTAARLERLLNRAGLATQIPDLRAQEAGYLHALAVDKNVINKETGKMGRIPFVALREIGRAEVCWLGAEEILGDQP